MNRTAAAATLPSKTDDSKLGTETDWFVDPITVKIAHDRRTAFSTSTKSVDLNEIGRPRWHAWGVRESPDLGLERWR